VLLNLVVNAREATLPGGTIRVRAGGADAREAQAAGPGRWCVLEVEDTGEGMSAEVRARLFEPFFTTKPNGTGFGLATVYGIVAQSGGHVAVRSAPGAGATFTVLLPAVDAGAEPATVGRGSATG
jgi:signal transduction histidine kinase